MLISILVALAAGVNLAPSDSLLLSILIAYSLVYLSFWVLVGVFVSGLVRNPSTSFLVLLVVWIGSVLVWPRVATELADSTIEVTTRAVITARQSLFARNKLEELNRFSLKQMERSQEEMRGMTSSERSAYIQEHQDAWGEESDKFRDDIFAQIEQNGIRLREDRQREVLIQERVTLNLARLSPASLFSVSAMRLAGTDLESKARFEGDLHEYGITLKTFLDGKGVIHSPTTEPGVDISELPRFEPSRQPVAPVIASTALDMVLLLLLGGLSLFGAIVAFERYDVR